MEKIVIIGGGHAGFQLSHSLRKDGFSGELVILEQQREYPYQRPPLSKAYLSDEINKEKLFFRTREFYEIQRINVVFGRVSSIDRVNKRVYYNNSQYIEYDKLVLATGSVPKKLAIQRLGCENVYLVDTLESVERLKQTIKDSGSFDFVVVGTGFVGIEFASVMSKRNKNVSVIGRGRRLLSRTVSDTLASIISDYHSSNGVNFYFQDEISDVTVIGNKVTHVKLRSGKVLPADAVVVGVGSMANDQLATDADLKTNNGVLVDGNLCTADPSIYAMGDCVRFPHNVRGHQRLESVQNAVDQARYLSKLLSRKIEEDEIYVSNPWCWSDQGDLKIQLVGEITDCDHTVMVSGSEEESEFSRVVYCFYDKHLVAVETINCSSVHMAARKVLTGFDRISLDELNGSGFDIRKLM